MPYQEVMKKFAKGKLFSGGKKKGAKHGAKVTSREQAIAIMLDEKRRGVKK